MDKPITTTQLKNGPYQGQDPIRLVDSDGVEMKFPPKPEYFSNLTFVRTLTPYVFTHRLVPGKSVLDVGCGLGHGTWLMTSSSADKVAAIDLDETRAHKAYEFCANFMNSGTFVMNAQHLAFENFSFQVVTCFEVIEHVPNPDMLLAELRRIIKADGIVILTTPNRVVRLLPLQRPWNHEHFREYTINSLRRSLSKYFPSYELIGITGEPEPYGYYRRLWRPRLRILHTLIPLSIRSRIIDWLGRDNFARSSNADSDLLNMVIPAPDPKNWPFYVRDVDEHCLNFMAICGVDDAAVQRAVKEIKEQSR